VTWAFVIAGSPAWPVTVVGPVALSVQAVAAAVPPPVLSTGLSRVRNVGGTYVFVIEQLELVPGARTRLLPVSVPAVQLQAPAA
jgi:hypothetical protein